MSYTAFQKLQIFMVWLHEQEVTPKRVTAVMQRMGVEVSPKQVRELVDRTRFSNTKAMKIAQFCEYKDVISRAYRIAEKGKSDFEKHNELLADASTQCETIYQRFYWREAAIGSGARGSFLERIQKAGKISGIVDNCSCMLSYLIASQALFDDSKKCTDRVKNAIQVRGKARVDMAVRLVDMHEKSDFDPLQSPNWMATGGGGFSGKVPNDSHIDSGKILASLTGNVPKGILGILKDALFDDVIFWGDGDLTSVDYIKMALDICLFNDLQLSEDELRKTWPDVVAERGTYDVKMKSHKWGKIDIPERNKAY